MIEVVCDRCGRRVSTRSQETLMLTQRMKIDDMEFDLCPNCRICIKKWIIGFSDLPKESDSCRACRFFGNVDGACDDCQHMKGVSND